MQRGEFSLKNTLRALRRGPVGQLLRRWSVHDAPQQGAALAYYLLFSLFPLLILVSSLIGQLSLDISGIADTLSSFLPQSVLLLAEAYLIHVSERVSAALLWFSAVFSVWFPMRATGCLMRAVRRAYDLGPPKNRLLHTFKVLFVTVLLLFALVLTLLLMTLGSRFSAALGGSLSLSDTFPRAWGFLRFAALGAVVFCVLGVLYAAAQDRCRAPRAIAPGAALAALSWLAISWGYAVYTEYLSDYSAVYGALGAVAVLLIWLYLTALTLIMGAECNQILLCRGAREDVHFDQGGSQ